FLRPPLPGGVLLCWLYLRGLAGRRRCFQAVRVDERARAHEGDPRNQYCRPHHHRSSDKIRREGTERWHPVRVSAEPKSDTDGRASNRGRKHDTGTADAALAGPQLSQIFMRDTRASLSRSPEPVVNHRPSAQPESPADNILALVHVFSNLIGRAFYGPLKAHHRLSVQQWRILLTLAHHPGATAVEIIARWTLQPMSVSRAIGELEQRGLIVRRIGSNDRRSQKLFLTRKGQRVYDTVVPDANARYHDIVDCLPPKERARLARAMVLLIANTKRLAA